MSPERLSVIQDADDLRGMLPDEILSEVRRLDERAKRAEQKLALTAGERDAVYEMATRITAERDAARAALAAAEDRERRLIEAGHTMWKAINAYMFGNTTTLPLLESRGKWGALEARRQGGDGDGGSDE